MTTYKLETDFIELCKLIKLVFPISTGGEAKQLITDGYIKVDGTVETRKKCKIRKGQKVNFKALEINVI